MSDQLRDCPSEFYSNCRNALIKCNLCSAGSGRAISKTLYLPITQVDELSQHPYSKVVDEQKKQKSHSRKTVLYKDPVKSKQIKEAFKHEKTLTAKIIKNTRRSGAEFGDGDKSILQGLIKMDDKRRFNTRSFTLSWREYQKGLRQGLNSWSITVEEDPDSNSHKDSTQTVVILTLDAFTTLLSLASQTLENSPSSI